MNLQEGTDSHSSCSLDVMILIIIDYSSMGVALPRVREVAGRCMESLQVCQTIYLLYKWNPGAPALAEAPDPHRPVPPWLSGGLEARP